MNFQPINEQDAVNSNQWFINSKNALVLRRAVKFSYIYLYRCFSRFYSIKETYK